MKTFCVLTYILNEQWVTPESEFLHLTFCVRVCTRACVCTQIHIPVGVAGPHRVRVLLFCFETGSPLLFTDIYTRLTDLQLFSSSLFSNSRFPAECADLGSASSKPLLKVCFVSATSDLRVTRTMVKSGWMAFYHRCMLVATAEEVRLSLKRGSTTSLTPPI